MEFVNSKRLYIVSVSNIDDTFGYDDIFDDREECQKYIKEQTSLICSKELKNLQIARITTTEYNLTDEQFDLVKGWTAFEFIDNCYDFADNSNVVEKFIVG